MEKIESLVGLNVRLFMDMYEIDGVLTHLDSEKVIIDSQGSVYLIYKDKINMVLLNPDEIQKQNTVPENSPRYNDIMESSNSMPHGDPDSIRNDPFLKRFAQNGVAEQNQYGTFIPRSLIDEEPPDIVDLMMGEGTPDVDLSVSQSMLRSDEALLARAARQKIIEKNKREIDGSEE